MDSAVNNVDVDPVFLRDRSNGHATNKHDLPDEEVGIPNLSQSNNGFEIEDNSEVEPILFNSEKDFLVNIRELAFLETINPPHIPSGSITAEQKLENFYSRNLERLQEIFGWKKRTLDKLRSQLDFENIGLTQRLSESEAEIRTLQSETIELEVKKGELEEKSKRASYDFATAKADIISRRISSAFEELEKIVHGFHSLHRQKKVEAKEEYTENFETLNSRKSRLEIHMNNCQEILENIEGRLGIFSNIGKGGYIFLLSTGYLAAMFFGWIFGNYPGSKSLNGVEMFTYLLTSLVALGNEKVATSGSSMDILMAFLVIVALVGVITFVAWICNWGLEKLRVSEPAQNALEVEFNTYFAFNVGDHGEIEFKKRSSDFFSIWLQVVPPLLIIAAIYVVISSQTGSAKAIEEILMSSTAQLMGFVVAIVSGGITFLILSLKPLQERLFSANRISLATIILVSIQAMLILSVGTLAFTNNSAFDAWFITPLLITTLLTSMISIGFGVLLRSHINETIRLKRTISWINYRLDRASRPLPLRLRQKELKQFRRRVIKNLDELYQLIHSKNEWTAAAVRGFSSVRFVSSIGRVIRGKLFRKKASQERVSTDKESAALIPITDSELNALPKEADIIRQLNCEYGRTTELIELNESRLVALKSDQDPVSVYLLQEIRRIDKRLSRLDEQEYEIRSSYSSEMNWLDLLKIKGSKEIREGVDLAFWYKENSIGHFGNP